MCGEYELTLNGVNLSTSFAEGKGAFGSVDELMDKY